MVCPTNPKSGTNSEEVVFFLYPVYFLPCSCMPMAVVGKDNCTQIPVPGVCSDPQEWNCNVNIHTKCTKGASLHFLHLFLCQILLAK